MNPEQRKQIERHGNNLNSIFELSYNPIKLCKKLRRLERKAHRLSTDYCNGDIQGDEYQKKVDKVLFEVKKVLGDKIPIIFNGDARGYALKISDTIARDLNIHRDMGGYGIIAPEYR